MCVKKRLRVINRESGGGFRGAESAEVAPAPGAPWRALFTAKGFSCDLRSPAAVRTGSSAARHFFFHGGRLATLFPPLHLARLPTAHRNLAPVSDGLNGRMERPLCLPTSRERYHSVAPLLTFSSIADAL